MRRRWGRNHTVNTQAHCRLISAQVARQWFPIARQLPPAIPERRRSLRRLGFAKHSVCDLRPFAQANLQSRTIHGGIQRKGAMEWRRVPGVRISLVWFAEELSRIRPYFPYFEVKDAEFPLQPRLSGGEGSPALTFLRWNSLLNRREFGEFGTRKWSSTSLSCRLC